MFKDYTDSVSNQAVGAFLTLARKGAHDAYEWSKEAGLPTDTEWMLWAKRFVDQDPKMFSCEVLKAVCEVAEEEASRLIPLANEDDASEALIKEAGLALMKQWDVFLAHCMQHVIDHNEDSDKNQMEVVANVALKLAEVAALIIAEKNRSNDV